MNFFSRGILIAIGVFIISLTVQMFAWANYSYIDEVDWVPATTEFANGHFFGEEQLIYGYPATTLLITATAFIHLGVNPTLALRYSLAFLLALITSLLALTAYRIRPQSLWWLALAVLFTTHHFYGAATPPSVLIGPLAVLYLLFSIELFERPGSKLAAIMLGATLGCMTATRFDISSALGLGALIFMTFNGRIRECGLIALTALGTFVLLDPYMFVMPYQHIMSFYDKLHLASALSSPPIVREASVFSFLLTVVAFLIVPLMTFTKRISPVVSSRIIFWLLCLTFGIGTLLLISPYHPLWYFFPLAAMWEALFALYMLDFIENLRVSEGLRMKALPVLFILFLFASQFPGTLLFYRMTGVFFQ